MTVMNTRLVCLLHLLLSTLFLVSVTDARFGPGLGPLCTNEDIIIVQGSTTPLPNGIPVYTAQIMNTCVSGCNISNIHVSCGWFSSYQLVDPDVFQRLSYNDCLVNGGNPLGAGESIAFQYANTFSVPLSVTSIEC